MAMALFNAFLCLCRRPSLSNVYSCEPSTAKKENVALKGDIVLPNKGSKVHPTGCSILNVDRWIFSSNSFDFTNYRFLNTCITRDSRGMDNCRDVTLRIKRR